MSIDVHKRGQSWRARVRIYKDPSGSSTFDTYAEANEWAILTNARLVTEHESAGNVQQPQQPSVTPNQFINALIEDILKEYQDNVLPTKAKLNVNVVISWYKNCIVHRGKDGMYVILNFADIAVLATNSNNLYKRII